MRFRGAEDEEEMQINLNPMIDCVFLLIIFFLVTTSFTKLEQDLSINLPIQSRVKTPTPPAQPIIVNVRWLPPGMRSRPDRDAYYHVDNERMSPAALTVNLSRARIRNKDQAVMIRGDRRVTWQSIAKVLECCARAGITKVSAKAEISERGRT